MPKVNPFGLRPLSRPSQRFTFTDQNQPGQVIETTLRGLDLVDQMAANALSDGLKQKWLVPDEDGNLPSYPLDWRGEPPRPCNAEQLDTVARLVIAQDVPPEEKYDENELIALSFTMPEAFFNMMNAIGTLNTSETDDGSGNPASDGTPTGSGSTVRLNLGLPTTPSSSSEETPSPSPTTD